MHPIRLALLSLSLFGLSCRHTPADTTFIPPAPDYALARSWFATDTTECPADVFYIAPTCIWDWSSPAGTVCHYMDTGNPAQRQAVDNALRLGEALFGESCRFFAPYYRQITMESWMTDPTETERRYAIAHCDIRTAFRHYLTRCNGGRPFLLAGHSQGAKAVIELLKHDLPPEHRSRLVSAYAFGFAITAEELHTNPGLQPAHDSIDLGTVVCFNSVSDLRAISPLLADNAVCINPLNWSTDTTYAPASRNLGSVFFRADGSIDTIMLRSVGARLDAGTHTLVIDGIDPARYYIPSIGNLFPVGNFHVQEINLYFNNLRYNIRQRIAAYNAR